MSFVLNKKKSALHTLSLTDIKFRNRRTDRYQQMESYLLSGSQEIVMKHKKWFNLSELQPACVGAGYVTLDAVLNGKLETPAKLWAGGSCGNVLTIMSYLGWSSYPIARLGYDPAATQVLSDLQSWGVNCSLIRQSDNYQTPIIIQRNIVNKSGILRHYFEFKCPYCGSQLPKFRPVLFNDIPEFTSIVPNTEVFYFDRVRRSSVELAKYYKQQGALIFFEPSSINCSYEGARGIMYNLCLEDLNELVSEILEGKPINVKGHKPTNEVQKDFKAICPSCVRNEANYVRL